MLTSKIGVLCIARVVGMSIFDEFFTIFVLGELSLSLLLRFFAGASDVAPEMCLWTRTTLAWDFTLGFKGLDPVAAFN